MGIIWKNCKLRHASISMLEQVFSGTVEGMRISAIDGTSFIDNAAALTAYYDGHHLIEIEDSAGKVLTGVLKAQGTGETLGSELVTNGGFETLDGGSPVFENWLDLAGGSSTVTASEDSYAGTYAASLNFDASGNYALIGQSDLYEEGKLYQNSFFAKTTATPGTMRVYGSGIVNVTLTTSYAEYSPYITGMAGSHSIAFNREGSAGHASKSFLIDSVSLKQVLTPSTLGATIVNTINGATQNFLTKDADFTYNAASYTVRVRRRISA